MNEQECQEYLKFYKGVASPFGPGNPKPDKRDTPKKSQKQG